MKKVLAIVLALLMLVGMAACGNRDNKDDVSDSDKENANIAGSEENGKNDVKEDVKEDETKTGNNEVIAQGKFDPDYDYSANPEYKICYYLLSTGVLYELMGDAFEAWCEQMNLEFGGMIDAGGDKDLYISNLVTLADEYDGLLIDPDAMQYDRCAEILNEAGTPWMGVMAEARDYSQDGNPLLHPYVGFNNYSVGVIMAEYLIDYAEKNWNDVDKSQIAWACVDYSTSPVLHLRETGFYETLTAYDSTIAERYWTADTSIATFDVDTSNTVVSSMLAEHTEYEYWCVFGEIDDMAQGAAAAFDTAGLTESAAVVTFGGTGLQYQWDAGMQDSWVAACYLPNPIYAEPIICALYAFMNGDATPETIWTDWVPTAEVVPYAMKLLPAYWIEYETYQHVIKWGDIYGGIDLFPDYPSTYVNENGETVEITRDDFSTDVEIPADRVGYNG